MTSQCVDTQRASLSGPYGGGVINCGATHWYYIYLPRRNTSLKRHKTCRITLLKSKVTVSIKQIVGRNKIVGDKNIAVVNFNGGGITGYNCVLRQELRGLPRAT